MGDFTSRVIVVTGAASGIGRALVEAFAQEGARVVAVDIDAAGLGSLVDSLRSAGRDIEGHVLDVSRAEEVESLAEQVWGRLGGVDLLVSNAGVAVGGEVLHTRLSDWRRVVEVNLMGVVHGIHAFYPRMVERGSGTLLNVASLGGLVPAPGLAAYSATKHALVGLSLSLRAEAADRGVRVSVVCPAFVRTPIFESAELRGPSMRVEEMIELIGPLPPISPERVARDVLRGLRRNRAVILSPPQAGHVWRFFRWMPGLGGWLLRRSARRVRAAIEAESGV